MYALFFSLPLSLLFQSLKVQDPPAHHIVHVQTPPRRDSGPSPSHHPNQEVWASKVRDMEGEGERERVRERRGERGERERVRERGGRRGEREGGGEGREREKVYTDNQKFRTEHLVFMYQFL